VRLLENDPPLIVAFPGSKTSSLRPPWGLGLPSFLPLWVCSDTSLSSVVEPVILLLPPF